MTDSQFNTGTRNQPLGDSKAGVSADLDALSAYVTSLTTESSSPNRNTDGTMTTDALAGERIFRLMLATASGQASKSELHGYGQNEFVPWQLGAVM